MKIPLPLVIIGGISTAVVGYGIKEVCADEKCFGLFNSDKNDNSASFEYKKAKTKKKGLKAFYNLRKDIFQTSHKEFNELISKVQNINTETKEDIALNENLPSSKPYSDEIKQTSKKLYEKLKSFNEIFELYITKISSMIKIADSYEAYSIDSKKIIDNSLKISNIIYDILKLEIIDEDNNLTQSSKDLLVKCDELMDEYIKEQANQAI